MGLFSFLSKGGITMRMTILEQDVKTLKEDNEELRRRLYQDERNIDKIVTQIDRLIDLVVMMANRR